jgi:hypothetical protein
VIRCRIRATDTVEQEFPLAMKRVIVQLDYFRVISGVDQPRKRGTCLTRLALIGVVALWEQEAGRVSRPFARSCHLARLRRMLLEIHSESSTL